MKPLLDIGQGSLVTCTCVVKSPAHSPLGIQDGDLPLEAGGIVHSYYNPAVVFSLAAGPGHEQRLLWATFHRGQRIAL